MLCANVSVQIKHKQQHVECATATALATRMLLLNGLVPRTEFEESP